MALCSVTSVLNLATQGARKFAEVIFIMAVFRQANMQWARRNGSAGLLTRPNAESVGLDRLGLRGGQGLAERIIEGQSLRLLQDRNNLNHSSQSIGNSGVDDPDNKDTERDSDNMENDRNEIYLGEYLKYTEPNTY
jgi:hypothetical protein